MKIIAVAIPIFLLFLAGEAVYSYRKQRDLYTFRDTFTNIGCGMVEQVLGFFIKGILFLPYLALYKYHFIADSFWSSTTGWIVAFLAIDMLYYFFHRTSHSVNAIWATHSIHHQSDFYNLSVALRQSALQACFSWPFFLPLAVLGVSPQQFLVCYAINLVYQFWIHTQLIKRLGPLEWILNTPSHHRVHHGTNTQYLDKNHAGVFIIWDRVFGTFEPEGETVVYGVTYPYKGADPIAANIHPWRPLLADARETRSLTAKALLWFAHNGWRPRDCTNKRELPALRPRKDRRLFVTFLFALDIALTMTLLAGAVPTGPLQIAAAVVSIGLLALAAKGLP